MLRALLIAGLLLASAAAAQANSLYASFVLGFGPAHFWQLETNGLDSVGGANATCSGTCTFSLPLAVNSLGYEPTTNSSGLQIGSVNLVGSPFSVLVAFKTSASGAQKVLDAFDFFTPRVLITIGDLTPGRCGAGLGQVVLTPISGSDNTFCTLAPVNDGVVHMMAIACDAATPPANCVLYLDGVSQLTSTFNNGSPVTGHYTIGNDDNGGTVPLVGSMGSLISFLGVGLTQPQILSIYQCLIGVSGVCGRNPTVHVVN